MCCLFCCMCIKYRFTLDEPYTVYRTYLEQVLYNTIIIATTNSKKKILSYFLLSYYCC